MEEAINLMKKEKSNHPLVGEYSKKLAEIQKKQLEKDINPKNSFEKRANEIHNGEEEKKEIEKYDHGRHKAIYERAQKNFDRAITIKIENSAADDEKDLMEIRNQLGDLHYNEYSFSECERIIKEVNKQKKDWKAA